MTDQRVVPISARLGEVTRRITKGTTPTSVGGEFTTSGIAFVKVESLQDDGQIDPRRLARIGEGTDELLRRSRLSEGDILFSIAGTIGRVARVGRWLLPANTNQAVAIVRPDEQLVDGRYLYYCLRDERRIHRARSRVVQSVQANLSLTELSEVEVPLFPPLEQRSIAEVLGALDDKIAANRRVLERADGLIRARYARQSTASKRNTLLADIASNVRKQVSPEDIDPDSPYIGLEHVPRRRMWIDGTGVGSDVSSAKTVYQRDDVLFGKLRPYFHKVAHAATAGVCSTDILVIRAKDNAMRGLVLAACTADETVAAAVASSEGTRMPRAKWADIAVVPVPDPESALIRQFSREVVECADAMHAHVVENERLTATRDALLPLLMSGKVRVKDVQDEVGELV